MSDRIKVNDARGNPIEIAAAIVWRVRDAAQALFDVEDYEAYVRVQAETAIRHLASSYPYDEGISDFEAVDVRPDAPKHTTELTLRSSMAQVTHSLMTELSDRLDIAGIAIDDAKLTHLAYAPEIAGVMLRRQQAEAIIAARQKIVLGAVTMVEMALERAVRAPHHRPRRRTQGGDGQQPARRAVLRERHAAGHQRRHAVQLKERR